MSGHHPSPSLRPLDIYVFASLYPSVYKPYYDAQFAEMIDQGHRLSIFARDHISRIEGNLVAEYDLMSQTRYLLANELGTTLRLTPRALGASMAHPASSLRRLPRALGWGPGIKRALKHLVRVLNLPHATPDLCLVHSHETMVLVPWLRHVYPDVPVALYFHGGSPMDAVGEGRVIVRSAFENATVIFTNTRAARTAAMEAGSPPERTRVIPVGFRLALFPRVPDRQYMPDGRLRIVLVGRLSEEKGHRVTLDAMASLKEQGVLIDCHFIGSGPLGPQLQDRAAELGVADSVTFCGSIPHEKVIERLGETDLLLLPSIPTGTMNETQGTVMQEALLRGALVVASRTGGIPESVPPFLDHLLVPPASAAELAAVIAEVAAMIPAEFRALADRGRAWVESRYDNKTLVPTLLAETLASPPLPD